MNEKQYIKKPIAIKATQWFCNGDHPEDYPKLMHDEEGRVFDGEGQVVRYYRHPTADGTSKCEQCGHTMHEHGWIDTLEGGHIVCPGDFIITGVKGERYPCKPDIFEQSYEPVTPDSVSGNSDYPSKRNPNKRSRR